MKKYKNVQEYLECNGQTMDNVKDILLTTALDMLGECAHNFNGDAETTEHAAVSLIILKDILDSVE